MRGYTRIFSHYSPKDFALKNNYISIVVRICLNDKG